MHLWYAQCLDRRTGWPTYWEILDLPGPEAAELWTYRQIYSVNVSTRPYGNLTFTRTIVALPRIRRGARATDAAWRCEPAKFAEIPVISLQQLRPFSRRAQSSGR